MINYFSVDLLLPYRIPNTFKEPIISITEKYHIIYTFTEEDVTTVTVGLKDICSRTKINVQILTPDDSLQLEDNEKDEIQQLVHFSIYVVNGLLNGLRAASEIMHIEPIVLNNLPGILNCVFKNKKIQYSTNATKLYDENNTFLNDKDCLKSLKILNIWSNFPSIEIPNSKFYSSKSYIINSRFIDGILELQTSFEIYVSTCIHIILDIKNIDRNEQFEIIKKISFRNRIENFLSKELKIDLSFKNNQFVINYNHYLYRIRNMIIHNGLNYYTRDESIDALRSYIELYNYIGNSMLENKFISKFIDADFNFFTRAPKEEVLKKGAEYIFDSKIINGT
jgi:hypothetical protein